MYKVNKLWRYILQHRGYSQYIMVTIYGTQSFKIVNQYVVHLRLIQYYTSTIPQKGGWGGRTLMKGKVGLFTNFIILKKSNSYPKVHSKQCKNQLDIKPRKLIIPRILTSRSLHWLFRELVVQRTLRPLCHLAAARTGQSREKWLTKTLSETYQNLILWLSPC